MTACAPLRPHPSADCQPPPDAVESLGQAWRVYQPDQPLIWTVSIRRRLFALQALLISAGMYRDPPMPPDTAYAQYASQFVRDLGASRNPGLADALGRLAARLDATHTGPDAELGTNCGLIAARRMLRAEPVAVSTDWVVQTITQGFAPYFQASIQQLVREHAVACSAQSEVDGVPESLLTCTMRKVGL